MKQFEEHKIVEARLYSIAYEPGGIERRQREQGDTHTN